MYNIRSDLRKILDAMTLGEKEVLAEYLEAEISAEKAAPKKSYLETQWEKIDRLMKELDLEPYIDDQIQINDIWEICDEMIHSSKLQTEDWEVRRKVLERIIDGEYFDYYGVCDPMMELFEALMVTQEERLEIADLIYEIGSGFMMRDGARIYRECGREDKYIAYVERCLRDELKPYLEVINYYRDKDPVKAAEIAELGLKKIKRGDRTDLLIYLIQNAKDNGDEVRYAQLMNGVKRRRNVDRERIWREFS